jgi:hypothetical protein
MNVVFAVGLLKMKPLPVENFSGIIKHRKKLCFEHVDTLLYIIQ